MHKKLSPIGVLFLETPLKLQIQRHELQPSSPNTPLIFPFNFLSIHRSQSHTATATVTYLGFSFHTLQLSITEIDHPFFDPSIQSSAANTTKVHMKPSSSTILLLCLVLFTCFSSFAVSEDSKKNAFREREASDDSLGYPDMY